MTTFRTSDLDIAANYKLLIGLIVPRPIAWVTSRSPNGKINLAPFSAFTFVSTVPPMVGISAAGHKDTPNNIAASGEFVVNVADTSLVEPLHLSSVEHPREISEVEELGLELADSSEISTPRLAIAPASMECRLHSVCEYGTLKIRFVVGDVLAFHIRDDLVVNGKVKTSRLDPLARLAGPLYSGIGSEIVMRQLNATDARPGL
jgi:flavin reductase (DIM6/NTAB) family NADH-FMN oxidoreductase RutF